MLIPRGTKVDLKLFKATSDVYLEAMHIIIKKNIAEKIFGNESIVLTAFYKNENVLLAAPPNEEAFRKIHKATQAILKDKNISGDKSIAIHELILDNAIDSSYRDLDFKAEEALHILKIKL